MPSSSITQTMDSVESHSSNVRAISIFAGYLTACALLTGLILRDLTQQYSKRQKNHPTASTPIAAPLFAVCALLSLGVTWHYMLSFFNLSYRAWAFEHGVSLPDRPQTLHDLNQWTNDIQLGSWLKDVKLFREAWEIAMETPGRLVWSQPIFFVTSIWAFYIGEQASLKKIKHAWTYMLLGQIVAISFAQCLFYIAVVLYPMDEAETKAPGSKQSQTPAESNTASLRTLLQRGVLAAVVVPVMSIPNVVATPRFLLILAIPHLALFIPPLVDPLLSRSTIQAGGKNAIQAENKRLYRFIVVAALIAEIGMVIKTLKDTMTHPHLHRHSAVYEHRMLGAEVKMSGNSLHGIWTSLYDHPAVSSVGWDSILCIMNYQIWHSARSLQHSATIFSSREERLKHNRGVDAQQ